MPSLDLAASGVVVLTGAYLIALGVICVLRPTVAASFFGAFAQTPVRHGLELVARVIVGAALLHSAPTMRLSPVFTAGGWMLIITSLLLAGVPWRMHKRFAGAAVPRAMQHLPLLAAGAVLGGAVVIWGWSGTVVAR